MRSDIKPCYVDQWERAAASGYPQGVTSALNLMAIFCSRNTRPAKRTTSRDREDWGDGIICGETLASDLKSSIGHRHHIRIGFWFCINCPRARCVRNRGKPGPPGCSSLDAKLLGSSFRALISEPPSFCVCVSVSFVSCALPFSKCSANWSRG